MSEEWVAYRFGLMCADKCGRVYGGYRLRDRTVCVALLVDLPLRHRLDRTEGVGGIRTARTGFEPADVLLTFLDQHPLVTTADVVKAGPVRLLDVLDPARLTVSRVQKRRMVKVEPALALADRKRVEIAALTGDADTAVTAALTAIAAALDWIPTEHRDALIEQCGVPAAFVSDSCAYLERSVAEIGLGSATPGGG